MIIILQHGLFGFAARKLGPLSLEYFSGVADALSNIGHTPIATGVNPVGSIAQRAAQLRQQILDLIPDSRRDESILIIAHSMGGLDAREMLARCGADLSPRVAAVITIATPHRGSPIADMLMSIKDKIPVTTPLQRIRDLQAAAMDLFARGFEFDTSRLPEWVQWLGLDSDAIANLTTEFCAGFNQRTPNAPGVRYFWVATNCTGNIPFFFKKTYDMVHKVAPPEGGENDGVVAIGSAEPPTDADNPWTTLGAWPVDHLNAVNMRLPNDPNRPDVTGRYVDLLTQLNKQGVVTPRDA